MWPVIINPGDKIRISAKNGYLSRKSFISRVGDVTEEKLFLVHTPISEGRFIELPVGDDYFFIFYTKNGLLEGNGTVLEHMEINGVRFIKIEIFDFNRIQRRLFYRLNCLLDFTFTRLEDYAEENTDGITIYKGVTKDLSGGGLRFFSNIYLNIGEHLLFEFWINERVVRIEGIIRGRDKLDDEGYKYDYRIQFVDVESAQQEQIIQYIFYVQREMIKKTKSIPEEE